MSSHYVLAINSGSSSLKVSLFSVHSQNSTLKRKIDISVKEIHTAPKLIINGCEVSDWNGDKVVDLRSALTAVFKRLEDEKANVIAVAHRIVHGGMHKESVLIDTGILREIDALSELAPLHNPACVEGVRAATSYFGSKVPQVGVFDTSFHASLPEAAATYGLPHNLTSKYNIKRYGFHGIAHAYLLEQYETLVTSSSAKKIITLHLGSGCSIAAISGGKSIDTSMGFTPLEGLMMATRSGDIDPSLVEFIGKREGVSASEVLKLLNTESGFLGISGGKSRDMRVLLEAADNDPLSRLAVDTFVYRIIKYTGAYIAALQGIDAIIFSGGIGENSPTIRKKIIDTFHWYGIFLDNEVNQQAVALSYGQKIKISTSQSKVEVYAIGCDENSYIANQALKVVYLVSQ